jgi:hypothetical protein
MKKRNLLLFFIGGLLSLQMQAQEPKSNDSKKYLINLKYIININNADGSNCELIGNLTLPVAKRRKEDLVSFLNIR